MGCCGGEINKGNVSTPNLQCNCDVCRGTCNQQSNFNCAIIRNVSLDPTITVSTEWNIPKCGNLTTIHIDTNSKIIPGAYLYSVTYGFFEIVTINFATGSVIIRNPCNVNVNIPGTRVPACTPFILVNSPIPPSNISSIFLASNFTAPNVGSCTNVLFTSSGNLTAGLTVNIGNALYYLADVDSGGNVIICNQGAGFEPGTIITAIDSFGNYVYPVSISSNVLFIQSSSSLDNVTIGDVTPSQEVVTLINVVNPFLSSELLLYGTAIGSVRGVCKSSTPPTSPNFSFVLSTTQGATILSTFEGLDLEDITAAGATLPPFARQIRKSFVWRVPAGGSSNIGASFRCSVPFGLGLDLDFAYLDINLKLMGVPE